MSAALRSCPAGTGYKVTFYCPDEANKDVGLKPLDEGSSIKATQSQSFSQHVIRATAGA